MTESTTLFNRLMNPSPDSFKAMLCQIIIQTQNHQGFCSLDLFNAAGSFFILTQQVIFLVVRVPLYPGNPVISHPKNHLASPSLREHGQILQQAAQSTSQRQKTWWEVGVSGRYLSEVEIVLEGQRDISVDVNLLLPINVIRTHLSPWHSTFPRELQPLEDSIRALEDSDNVIVFHCWNLEPELHSAGFLCLEKLWFQHFPCLKMNGKRKWVWLYSNLVV